jgi:hypothetical protein
MLGKIPILGIIPTYRLTHIASLLVACGLMLKQSFEYQLYFLAIYVVVVGVHLGAAVLRDLSGAKGRALWSEGNYLAIKAMLVASVCVACYVVGQIDYRWSHYEVEGPIHIAYWVSRLVLIFFILYALTSVGDLLIHHSKLFGGNADSGHRHLILSFMLGASVYNFVFSLVGVAGMLDYRLCLISLFLPFLFTSRRILAGSLEILGGANRQLMHRRDAGYSQFIVDIVANKTLLTCCVLLLITKGLYPGNGSNDAYEHYLPYFSEVIESGSAVTAKIPGQIPPSKGAGLVFLSLIVTDILGAQLISWCLIFMAGIALYDLLMRITGIKSMAAIGTSAFYGVYSVGYSVGGVWAEFCKHHEITAGFICLLIWACAQVEGGSGNKDIVRRVTIVASFCLGFYQPVISFYCGICFAVGWLWYVYYPEIRIRRMHYQYLQIALISGVSLSLLLNYWLIGIPEIVPITIFKNFVDWEKLRGLFGVGSIAYHLYGDVYASNEITNSFNLYKMATILRLDFLKITLPLMNLPWIFYSFLPIITFAVLIIPFVLYLVVFIRNHRTLDSTDFLKEPRLLGLVAVSLICAVVLSQSMSVGSLFRVYGFVTFSVVVIGVTGLATLIPDLQKGPLFFNIAMVSCVCFLVTGYTLAGIGESRLRTVFGYLCGGVSPHGVFQENEITQNRNLKIDTVRKIRREIGPEAMLMNIGYDPAPAYSFPGLGIFSEPSHAYGPQHLDIIFGAPSEARLILERLGLNFFLLNLQSHIQSSLPFSQLFKSQNIDQYFSLAYSEGNTFVLTWRTDADSLAVPARFKEIFELKQTGVVSKLLSYSRSALETDGGTFSSFVDSQIVSRLYYQENINLVRQMAKILDRPKARLASDRSESESDQTEMNKPSGQTEVQSLLSEKLSPELASILLRADETRHFGSIYRSRESVEALLP